MNIQNDDDCKPRTKKKKDSKARGWSGLIAKADSEHFHRHFPLLVNKLLLLHLMLWNFVFIIKNRMAYFFQPKGGSHVT